MMDAEKKPERAKFLQIFKTLPTNLKNLITSPDTAEKIVSITSQFKLDNYDTEFIALATRKLATNTISTIQAKQEIFLNTEIADEDVSDILVSLAKEIFQSTPRPQGPRASTTPINTSVNPSNVVDLRNK